MAVPTAQTQVIVDDSLSHQRWNDPQYPYNPLDRSTALAYFELSPFFDASAANTAARQRGLDPAIDGHLSQLPPGAPEFVLAQTAEPHLFVVRRQTRSAGQPPRLGVQAYYYILGNERHTYQAPSLHTLITARMRRAMACVRQGLATFKADLAPLPAVLTQHQQDQAALGAAQAERLAALQESAGATDTTDGTGMMIAAAAAAAGAHSGGGTTAPPGPVAPPTLPLPEVQQTTPDEAEDWARSDAVIMSVLRRYPVPRLPPTKAEQQERERQLAIEQEQRAAAAAAAAAAPGQQQRRLPQDGSDQAQQGIKRRRSPGPSSPSNAAAAAAAPAVGSPQRPAGSALSQGGGTAAAGGRRGAAAEQLHSQEQHHHHHQQQQQQQQPTASSGSGATAGTQRSGRPPPAPAPSVSVGATTGSQGTMASAGGSSLGKVKLRFKLTKKLPGQAIAPGSGGGNASGAGTHSEDAAGSEPASKRTRQ